jgi:hypothetical protein
MSRAALAAAIALVTWRWRSTTRRIRARAAAYWDASRRATAAVENTTPVDQDARRADDRHALPPVAIDLYVEDGDVLTLADIDAVTPDRIDATGRDARGSMR